jgi:hypothetical protein
VQKEIEKRVVNLNLAVVCDEAQLPEAIHKKLTRDQMVPGLGKTRR